jgi:TolB protein
MSVDGSGQTNLTQGRPKNNAEPAGSVLPRWSPDGTRLLFGTESINYRYVYVMNADGTGLSQLIGLHQSMQPAWSPDGTKVTFIALNSLYVSNSDGTGQTQITNNIFYNFKPDWQPLAGATPTMQMSAGNYNVGEAAGHVTITVNRSSSSGDAILRLSAA